LFLGAGAGVDGVWGRVVSFGIDAPFVIIFDVEISTKFKLSK
jgi:hypothetical protein